MMGRTISICALQLRLSAVHNNWETVARQVELALHRFPWTQMIVLSELAVCGILTGSAEPLPGPTESGFTELARRHGVWIVTGSLFERADGGICNTSSVVDPHGDIVCRYRKMFPFLPFEEGVVPGDEFVVFDVPGVGRFGCTICYDIWFPEVCRTLAAMGAEVILRPTLTNTIDREMELTIVKAMAAVNQAYVVDVNGVEGGGNGRSLIVDPEGLVLHQAGEVEELIPVELDLNRAAQARRRGFKGLGQTLKSFRDRRVEFDLYKSRAFGADYLASLGPLEKGSSKRTTIMQPAAATLG
jgi:predicted amidohydrolase